MWVSLLYRNIFSWFRIFSEVLSFFFIGQPTASCFIVAIEITYNEKGSNLLL